ncbi:hypothetical protein F2P81_008414 [Scophthalmus maximus]|uniref:Uncharacterized protein n=1 Tax=Scophthalmus maximus TaxID=52904 RepID=A0A6A4T5H7_SCOMX|nr:hypothetical protein F2P81_008414 [Scophthalmus maximus]
MLPFLLLIRLPGLRDGGDASPVSNGQSSEPPTSLSTLRHACKLMSDASHHAFVSASSSSSTFLLVFSLSRTLNSADFLVSNHSDPRDDSRSLTRLTSSWQRCRVPKMNPASFHRAPRPGRRQGDSDELNITIKLPPPPLWNSRAARTRGNVQKHIRLQKASENDASR